MLTCHLAMGCCGECTGAPLNGVGPARGPDGQRENGQESRQKEVNWAGLATREGTGRGSGPVSINSYCSFSRTVLLSEAPLVLVYPFVLHQRRSLMAPSPSLAASPSCLHHPAALLLGGTHLPLRSAQPSHLLLCQWAYPTDPPLLELWPNRLLLLLLFPPTKSSQAHHTRLKVYLILCLLHHPQPIPPTITVKGVA